MSSSFEHRPMAIVSCLSTSDDQACCITLIICLINPLEGLLVRSYYCICASCVSFVNAFRHCRVITAHCVRSCALLSHAMRLWLPPAPNPVEPLRTSLFVLWLLSWLANDLFQLSVIESIISHINWTTNGAISKQAHIGGYTYTTTHARFGLLSVVKYRLVNK